MNRRLVISAIVATPALIFVLGQACSDTKLSRGQLTQSSTAGINFCTTPAQSIKSNLKYIFVLDHSGSNEQNYIPHPVTGVPLVDNGGGSDRLGNKRFPPLVDFLTKVNDNENTFYSVVNFSSSARTALPWVNNGNRTTSLQAQNFLAAEQTRTPGTPPRPNDTGGTNYLATIDIIYDMIAADVLAEKNRVTAANSSNSPIVSSDYVIFWVSDGAPFVNGELQNLDTITGNVKKILALKKDDPDYINSITLSTGFYHVVHDTSQLNCTQLLTAPLPANLSVDQLTCLGEQQDQLSADYMNAIATAGEGIFIDFQSAVIDYTKFSVPLRSVKYQLKDIWIQNLNTVWWNGQLLQDLDSDALPDDVEAQMGSNINLSDSDGNGVGDGAEYFLFGRPCSDAACNAARAASYQVQCGALPAGGYIDFDRDGLNNCEERLLGSRFDDFDSNLDYVPDQFSWVNKVGFVAGVKDILSDPDGDNVTNYFELKYNMPTQYANSFIKVVPMQYGAQIVSDNSVQTCYQINIGRLSTMSPRDMIRVYIMEARGAVGTNKQMRVAQKRISGGNLILSNSDFTP